MGEHFTTGPNETTAPAMMISLNAGLTPLQLRTVGDYIDAQLASQIRIGDLVQQYQYIRSVYQGPPVMPPMREIGTS